MTEEQHEFYLEDLFRDLPVTDYFCDNLCVTGDFMKWIKRLYVLEGEEEITCTKKFQDGREKEVGVSIVKNFRASCTSDQFDGLLISLNKTGQKQLSIFLGEAKDKAYHTSPSFSPQVPDIYRDFLDVNFGKRLTFREKEIVRLYVKDLRDLQKRTQGELSDDMKRYIDDARMLQETRRDLQGVLLRHNIPEPRPSTCGRLVEAVDNALLRESDVIDTLHAERDHALEESKIVAGEAVLQAQQLNKKEEKINGEIEEMTRQVGEMRQLLKDKETKIKELRTHISDMDSQGKLARKDQTNLKQELQTLEEVNKETLTGLKQTKTELSKTLAAKQGIDEALADLQREAAELLKQLDYPVEADVTESVRLARHLIVSGRRHSVALRQAKAYVHYSQGARGNASKDHLSNWAKVRRATSNLSLSSIPQRPGSSTSSTASTETSSTFLQCRKCPKSFRPEMNFEGACRRHQTDATVDNAGTPFEKWSCCNGALGCVLEKHEA